MIGLHPHPKTGGYWFKRGIPAKFKAAFGGKTTWYENLKTKDRRVAETRYHEAALRFQSLLSQAEEQLARREPAPTSPALLTGMVQRWRVRECWRRAELVVQGDPMPGWSDFIREAQLADLRGYKPKNEEPLAFMRRIEERTAFIEQVAEELCREVGVLIPPDHPGRSVLCRMIGDAWREILELEERWRAHDFVELPTEPPTVAPVAAPVIASVTIPSRAALGPTLSEALEVWKTGGGARNAKTPAPRTIIEASTAVRRFKEVHGDLPIRAIKKDHARQLRDALAKVPIRLTAEQRAKSLPDLLALNLRGTLPTAQTLNKQINLIFPRKSGRVRPLCARLRLG